MGGPKGGQRSICRTADTKEKNLARGVTDGDCREKRDVSQRKE